MNSNISLSVTDERRDQSAVNWALLRKIDKGTRFHLHGPTRQEEAELNRASNSMMEASGLHRSSVTAPSTEASFSSPSVSEAIELGDESEDPNLIDHLFAEDCAGLTTDEEEEGEVECRDPIDGDFCLQDDGRVWVWWLARNNFVYSNDGGHNHEVRYIADEHAQQNSPPGGYTYHRDGHDMKVCYDHLDEALAHVRREVEAQYLFERKLWPALRCSGACKAQQEYILSHAFYAHRVILIEEVLKHSRNCCRPG
jgi:hypothetical protein